MHWCFGLKIREQFTVSAFSVTVWQTLLHILIIVYWNKSGLIQTDATNDIVVNSFFGVTNNRVYNDVFRTFTFSMQQSESFVSSTHNYHMTKTNQDNSFNFRFQNWERWTIEKTILDNMGWILLFLYLFFFNNNTNTGFSSRHRLRLQKFCLNSHYMTGNFWMQ